MKILITSGGTRVPIDRVRHIANMSRGTFGSRIAKAALQQGHEVIFLHAKGSRSPFTHEFDFDRTLPGQLQKEFEDHLRFRNEYSHKYHSRTYVTFEDYKRHLESCLAKGVDAVILAAAVSDYGVANYVEGKIRSQEEQIINLSPLPKLISTARDLCPTAAIIGFKLLVDSTDEELEQAAWDSLVKNRLDLVVGNDLRDIQDDSHRLLLALKGPDEKKKIVKFERIRGEPMFLANVVIGFTVVMKGLRECVE